MAEFAGVDADVFVREAFDVSAMGESSFELVERSPSESVDRSDVCVDGVGEVLGAGSFEGVDEFVIDVLGFLGRQRYAVLVVAFERVAGEEVVLFGFWSCDHEQVGVLSAGHVDVCGFSVEAVEAHGDRLFPGAALGACCGEGVGMVDASTVGEIGLVEDDDRVAIVEDDAERAVTDPDDGAGLAVGNGDVLGVQGARPIAVAAQHDSLPDPVAAMPVVPVEVGGEFTLVDQLSAGGVIEDVDEFVGPGEQHNMAAVATGLLPPVDRDLDHLLTVVSDCHSLVVEVGAHRDGDVAGAQFGERVLFPGCVLTSVHGQFRNGARACGCGREPASGVDLGELVVIADKDHPSPGLTDKVDASFEESNVGHSRFVDDHHGGGGWLLLAAFPRSQQRMQGA